MAKKTISDYEDAIDKKRILFRTALQEFIVKKSQYEENDPEIQFELNNLHNAATDYFSQFERTLSEYANASYGASQNIQLAKVASTKKVLAVILAYWDSIRHLFKGENDIALPQPANGAYSNMQQYLKTFDPSGAAELKKEYEKAGLSVEGFLKTEPWKPLNYIEMTETKQQEEQRRLTRFGIISGLVLLVGLIAIALIFECPTQLQSLIFTVVMALAGAAFSMAITGRLSVTHNKTITAGGALAVFVLIFFFKPVQIEDFKDCKMDLSGSVYYGGSPYSDVDVLLFKSDQRSNSNANGNFTIKNVDFSAMSDPIELRIVREDIQLDTIIKKTKKELKSNLDLRVVKHCVTCVQKDSTGLEVNRVQKCSADNKYIKDYIAGMTKASNEQNLTLNCNVKTTN